MVKRKFTQPQKYLKILLHFMSLLTALIVKNSQTVAGIYLIFLQNKSYIKFKKLSIPHSDLSEMIWKIVTR